MELEKLKGNIIGVISDDYELLKYQGLMVKDIVKKKSLDALKMAGLTPEYMDKLFDKLAYRDKNKVILASKLQDKVIILNNFSKGLTGKDIEHYKKLFKRIVSYNRKIILIDKNSEMFINLVDKFYVINKDIVYETDDIFDNNLGKYIELPEIVKFNNKSNDLGVKINHYKELDDLLKAIYRIKS